MGKDQSPFQRVLIVGVGLLGASFAEALKKIWPTITLYGISSPSTIQAAIEQNVLNEGGDYKELNRFASQSDLILLCTPINHILDTLKQWQKSPPNFPAHCLISDVGSTKKEICWQGAELEKKCSQVHFIGSHPMAGSEKRGLDARDAKIFENAAWVLCEQKPLPEKLKTSFLSLLEKMGSRIKWMAPDHHDKVVATISHVPQLLSTCLAQSLAMRHSIKDSGLEIAGGGFRDMTRLAASAYSVWEDILNTNHLEIEVALKNFQKALQQAQEDLTHKKLEKTFAEANELRSHLQNKNQGFSSALTEILVDLKDHSGALVEALNPIAAAGLNILDLEILKVREGEGGTLMMAFKNEQEAKDAISILNVKQIESKLRA